MLTSFILALSTAKTTVKVNLGPKIFVVNLMIMDLMHSLCALFSYSGMASESVLMWWLSLFGKDPDSLDHDGEASACLTNYHAFAHKYIN